jgi:hypothetical protein
LPVAFFNPENPAAATKIAGHPCSLAELLTEAVSE